MYFMLIFKALLKYYLHYIIIKNGLTSHNAHSEKRRRSRSPHSSHESPSDRLEKRARDNRRTRHDKPEFFQSGAGPRGGVCAVCLGRHKHAFTKCDWHQLWDSSAGAARKNEQGRLVATDGLHLG